MSFNKYLTLGISAILLSACGATGAAFSSITPPSEGNAKIYVYRPKAIKGGGIHFNVFANDTLMGDLRNGGFLSLEVPTGDYEVWGKTEVKRGVNVSLAPNEIQCIRAKIGFGAFVGRPKLETVSMAQCKQEIVNTVGHESIRQTAKPNVQNQPIVNSTPSIESTSLTQPVMNHVTPPSTSIQGEIELKPIN